MKIVVALGGNALGDSPEEQRELVKNTSSSVADLVEKGHDVVVVHGNGPQVGMIESSFETASQVKDNIPLMPLPECGAMSQGYIGYHLQNGLLNALKGRNIDRNVATVVTQTLVDKKDKAFDKPSKPIGPFYDEDQIKKLQKETGLEYIEDSGRGYRFVVPSPKPVDILEKNSIKTLLDNNTVVIAAGGGGVPVYEKDGRYMGISAVIDKDSSSARLAEIIDADIFVILTAVKRVMINFGKPGEQSIEKMSVKEATKHIEDNQFPPGSMRPKVEAAIDFVNRKEDSQAIIAALEDASDAIAGKAGTIVYKGINE